MNNFRDLAYGRRSIRKFEKKDIPISDIEEIIRIAASAPSGCNSQCWRFIAIRDRSVIQSIADAVVKKTEDILSIKKDELTSEYLTSKRKVLTFFTNAPVVVAVFMTGMDYYDPILISALHAHGYDYENIMNLIARPDLLSIGAAVQNLLLAVHEMGYGACWMNEPAIASEEISKILEVPADCKFISLIPIGIPAYVPREKKLKPFEDIFTIK